VNTEEHFSDFLDARPTSLGSAGSNEAKASSVLVAVVVLGFVLVCCTTAVACRLGKRVVNPKSASNIVQAPRGSLDNPAAEHEEDGQPEPPALSGSRDDEPEPPQVEIQIVEEQFPFTYSQKVEYYSATNRQWMVGSVVASRGCSDVQGPESAADSSAVGVLGSFAALTEVEVITAEGPERRSDVPLDLLRTPLCEGELVEVLYAPKSTEQGTEHSPESVGSSRPGPRPHGAAEDLQWVVLPGKISRPLIAAMSAPRYEVCVEQPNIDTLHVLGHHVRRRFPTACAVDVYQGVMKGWCRGFVVDAGGAEPPEMPSEQSPASDSAMADNGAAAGRALECWSWVPVNFLADEEETGSFEWVPSYLLRNTGPSPILVI
jgi:hypothetical protein